MRKLLQIIREELSSDSWNQAVKIARSQQVYAGDAGPSINGKILYVVDPKTQLTAKVSLWPDDEDWLCEQCSGACCQHVAAAIIAQVQGFVQEKDANNDRSQHQPQQRPFLQYEFRPFQGPNQKNYLQLFRYYQNPQNEIQSVGRSLVGLQGKVLYDQQDLEIDQFFLKHEASRYERGFWIQLWPYLMKKNITFAAQAAKCSDRRRGYALSSEGRGGAVWLKLRAEDCDDIYDNGLARKNQEFFIASRLSDDPWGLELFEKGRLFGFSERDRVRAEYLPRLQAVFATSQDLHIEAATDHALPRLLIDSKLIDNQAQNSAVLVQAKIVYGDPIEAIFDGQIFKQVGACLPRRRLDLEAPLQQTLQRNFGLSLGEPRIWSFAEAQDWAGKLASSSMQQDFSDPAVFGAFRDLGQLKIQSYWNPEAGSTYLELKTTGSEHAQHVSLSDFQKLLQRGHQTDGPRLLDWLGQGLVILPESWTPASDEFLASLLREKDSAQSRLIDYWALEAFQEGIPVGDHHLNLQQIINDQDLVLERQRIPQEFWGKLRPYQKAGVDFLLRMQLIGAGALLADEMGLGKTIQAMAVMKAGSLLVCPASLIFNWQEELQRFRPDLKIRLYHGKSRSLDQEADVFLTSYGLVRQDFEILRSRVWQQLILDEAQIIKNADSDTSQKIKLIPASWRLALSGTPMENDLRDLLSLQQFLNPVHAAMDSKNLRRQRGDLDITFFKRWLEPFYLRRRKKDVLKDLPERSDILVRLQLSDSEGEIYRQEVVKVFAAWQQVQAQGANFTEILALLTRLRRTACDYRVALGQDEGDVLPVKAAYLLEKVSSLTDQGHAVIIVSQWTSMLDQLNLDFGRMGVRCLQLDGRSQNRGELVRRFSDGEAPVLLLSLKAGGVGLNLTVADHIFLLDPWWNVAAEEQAFARIHRIGQEQPVFMHRLLALGTIEEHVYRLQSQKRDLFNQFFDDDLTAAQKTVSSQSSRELTDILQQAFQGQH